MPELPDVDVFRRYVNAAALKQPIADVRDDDAADMLTDITIGGLAERLAGEMFTATRRHGKHLFIRIGENGWLMLHFGMTGFFRYFKNDDRRPPHVRLEIDFENGYSLAFDCQRRLGRIEHVETPDAFVQKQNLGPDALNDIGPEDLARLVSNGRGMIKSLLMNQEKIAGVGNIYSDEILFHARMHPRTKLEKSGSEDVHRLYDAMRRTLRIAIDAGADPESMPADFLLPRRKKGADCPRCGGRLEALKTSGRTARLCPNCQELKE